MSTHDNRREHPATSMDVPPMQVFAVYENQSRQAAISQQLSRRNINVMTATSIGGLRCLLRHHAADAVLLEDSGAAMVDMLAAIRLRVAPGLPVFAVGTPNGIGIIEAMTHGASDYFDCEMSVDQIEARLRAHANGKIDNLSQEMRVGQFTLSEATKSIRLDDVELTLTPREFALAKILFAGVGRVVPLSSLSARVWGVSVELSKRTLEQHVYKLRRKLKACFREDVRIQAAYGIGYRLDLIVSVPSGATAAAPAETATQAAATQAASTGGWTGIERRRSVTQG